jgi:uncharacterized protein YjbI with pentapeptide repeats
MKTQILSQQSSTFSKTTAITISSIVLSCITHFAMPAEAQTDVQKFIKEKKCTKCNLSGANLADIDFTDSDVSGSNLSGSNLSKSVFKRAKLQDTNLGGTSFKDTDIDGASFQGAKGLKPQQIKEAKNWNKASFDKDFRDSLEGGSK